MFAELIGRFMSIKEMKVKWGKNYSLNVCSDKYKLSALLLNLKIFHPPQIFILLFLLTKLELWVSAHGLGSKFSISLICQSVKLHLNDSLLHVIFIIVSLRHRSNSLVSSKHSCVIIFCMKHGTQVNSKYFKCFWLRELYWLWQSIHNWFQTFCKTCCI